MMERCKPKQDAVNEYFETYDFLFAPKYEFIEELGSCPQAKTYILDMYSEHYSEGFDYAKELHGTVARELNLIMNLILAMSSSKTQSIVASYFWYSNFKQFIKNYIVRNSTAIVNGSLDSQFEDKPKVLERLKDMAYRSSEYAKKNSNNMKEFRKSAYYSVNGLINNERGASLYRIWKAFHQTPPSTPVVTSPEVTQR